MSISPAMSIGPAYGFGALSNSFASPVILPNNFQHTNQNWNAGHGNGYGFSDTTGKVQGYGYGMYNTNGNTHSQRMNNRGMDNNMEDDDEKKPYDFIEALTDIMFWLTPIILFDRDYEALDVFTLAATMFLLYKQADDNTVTLANVMLEYFDPDSLREGVIEEDSEFKRSLSHELYLLGVSRTGIGRYIRLAAHMFIDYVEESLDSESTSKHHVSGSG